MLDFSSRFDRWYEQLPASPLDVGEVVRCVVRPANNERRTQEEVHVIPGRGLDGDHWGGSSHDGPRNEVSLINIHVALSVAKGDAARTSLTGDNFHVDLDLTEHNLPVGSTLELGQALLRVSDKPHRPCLKFVKRFGPRAAKRVARANRVGRRGRGVLCEVVRGGAVRVGDPIRVTRPTAPAG